MSNQAEQSQTREIGVSEAATRMAALLGGDEPKPTRNRSQLLPRL